MLKAHTRKILSSSQEKKRYIKNFGSSKSKDARKQIAGTLKTMRKSSGRKKALSNYLNSVPPRQ